MSGERTGSYAGKWWLTIGALFGFASVALGAFGAHGLKTSLRERDLSPQEQTQRLDNWEVAARYQMYHGLALIAVGLLAGHRPRRLWSAAAAAFTVGVLIFSGCLYAYVLSGAKPWALVVPVGGVLLLLGWLSFLLAVLLPPASAAAARGR